MAENEGILPTCHDEDYRSQEVETGDPLRSRGGVVAELSALTDKIIILKYLLLHLPPRAPKPSTCCINPPEDLRLNWSMRRALFRTHREVDALEASIEAESQHRHPYQALPCPVCQEPRVSPDFNFQFYCFCPTHKAEWLEDRHGKSLEAPARSNKARTNKITKRDKKKELNSIQ